MVGSLAVPPRHKLLDNIVHFEISKNTHIELRNMHGSEVTVADSTYLKFK